jgi:diguanylate cyclase (GGDEF)-like protein/PAS domain S-box-containing protein
VGHWDETTLAIGLPYSGRAESRALATSLREQDWSSARTAVGLSQLDQSADPLLLLTLAELELDRDRNLRRDPADRRTPWGVPAEPPGDARAEDVPPSGVTPPASVALARGRRHLAEQRRRIERLLQLDGEARALRCDLGTGTTAPRNGTSRSPRPDQRPLLSLLAETPLDLLTIHAPNGVIVYASPNAEALSGWKPEELVGRSPYDFLHPDDVERILHDHASDETPHAARVRYRCRGARGEYRWVETRSRSAAEGGLIMAITRDVEAEERAIETLRDSALRDPLTNLPNRRAAEEMLRRETERARRLGEALTIAFLDLDEFKSLNDREGHAAGDEALREVARILEQARRAYDTGARWGGDELLLILPVTEPAGACDVIERLRSRVEGLGLGISVSAGIACNSATDDPEALVHLADCALYEAKRRGGGCTVTWADVPEVRQ